MAIAKDIAIHKGTHLNNAVRYVADEEKTCLGDEVFVYAANREKTTFVTDGDEDILVSGNRCNPEWAVRSFRESRDRYFDAVGTDFKVARGTKTDKSTGEQACKEEIEAYHIIQSFPAIDGLDPRLVHQIGLEFAQSAFADHKSVICTHMNTDHLHNHIIVCAYKESGTGKYKMDKAHRREYREINDQISQKYGLPVILDPNQAHRAYSWVEWDALRNDSSWKQSMKNDLGMARRNASSWEEYSSILEAAGYKIRYGNKYVTYTMPGDESKKCRDRTLGEEYLRINIERSFESSSAQKNNMTELVNELNKALPPHKIRVNFHVSRYTETGRRRSDLEIIFLKAIRIIRYFADKFNDCSSSFIDSTNPVYYGADVKLRVMEQSIYMCRQLGIGTLEDLNSLMSDTGARLSHLKKELSNMEPRYEYALDILEKINMLNDLRPDIDHIGYSRDLMYLDTYTAAEISLNRASAMPMSPDQRRRLFIAVQDNPSYKLDCSFDEISFEQAEDIIGFLNGRSSTLPLHVIDYNSPMPHKSPDGPSDDRLINEARFISEIEKMSLKDQQTLSKYRSILNDLRSYGLDISYIDSVLNEIEVIRSSYLEINRQKDALSLTYRDLSKLKHNLDLAQTVAFTHGPLYVSSHANFDNIEETDHYSSASASEDLKTDKSIERNNPDPDKAKRKGFFSDISDDFFDRL